jgi:hypothetical protein
VIPIFWVEHTATVNGRVLKLVPCENCSIEYVYVLEREGTGFAVSPYALYNEEARDYAASSADDTLQQYLANDFDPVPCPACGHYQQYMFPKLIETHSPWGAAAKVAVLMVVCLSAVTALYWGANYAQRPGDRALTRLVAAGSVLAVAGVAGVGLWALERARVRSFDPNTEDQAARIARGRSRAVTRAEFEALQRARGEGGA